MLAFLQKRWFLVALLTLIVSGMAIGGLADKDTILSVSEKVPPRFITAFVLFLMAFSLDSRQLKAAFKSPAPVILACSTNYLLIPLLGWASMSLQQTPDFTIGVMIAASTPATLAAASVWTRKAGGNDAVSLLTTLITNTFCFAITPLWLEIATSETVQLDMLDMARRLIYVVLIPTLLGQLVRMPAKSTAFAVKHKTPIGVVAQSSILVLVFLSSCKGGVQLQSEESGLTDQLTGVVIVWASVIAIHLIAFAVAWYGGGLFGFDRKDRIGASFAGSQKTLPIGVFLATDPESGYGGDDVFNGGPVPFAVFPMLMFHASQLFIDTLIADRLAKQTEKSESDNNDKTAANAPHQS